MVFYPDRGCTQGRTRVWLLAVHKLVELFGRGGNPCVVTEGMVSYHLLRWFGSRTVLSGLILKFY